MSAEIVQVDYAVLESIAGRFGRCAEQVSEIQGRLSAQAEQLAGSWQGRGSQAFFHELRSEILPATQRLSLALQEARTVTFAVRDTLRAAEEEAASPFQSSAGQSSAGAGQPAGETAAAGPAAPASERSNDQSFLRQLDESLTLLQSTATQPLGTLFSVAGAIGSGQYWRRYAAVTDEIRAAGVLTGKPPWFSAPDNPSHPGWSIHSEVVQRGAGRIGRALNHPLVKGAGGVLDVVNFGVSGYALVRDLQQGFNSMRSPVKIADAAADTVGVAALFLGPTPAGAIGGAFAAGYGVGKALDSGMESLTGFAISDIGGKIYDWTH